MSPPIPAHLAAAGPLPGVQLGPVLAAGGDVGGQGELVAEAAAAGAQEPRQPGHHVQQARAVSAARHIHTLETSAVKRSISFHNRLYNHGEGPY